MPPSTKELRNEKTKGENFAIAPPYSKCSRQYMDLNARSQEAAGTGTRNHPTRY